MPTVPIIEVIADKVVTIGYPLNAASTISTDLQKKDWVGIKRILEAAGPALVDLHSKKGIFQGGIDFDTICYASQSKQAIFMDWSRSCTSNGVGQRLQYRGRYYFKNNRKTSFSELLVSDILAFMLVYADLVAELNRQVMVPSCAIREQWDQTTPAGWNSWLKHANLT